MITGGYSACKELEKPIEDFIVREFEKRGGICPKTRVIGERGWPDRLGVLKGRFFPIELKRPEGKLAAQQLVWARRLRSVGSNVYTIWSMDQAVKFMEWIDEIL